MARARLPRDGPNPKNPKHRLVAALGHAYGASPDRGVYRRAMRATWQKVTFQSDDVGAIDLAFDSNHSQVIYATCGPPRRPAVVYFTRRQNVPAAAF